jgi:hypothetical protein
MVVIFADLLGTYNNIDVSICINIINVSRETYKQIPSLSLSLGLGHGP